MMLARGNSAFSDDMQLSPVTVVTELSTSSAVISDTDASTDDEGERVSLHQIAASADDNHNQSEACYRPLSTTSCQTAVVDRKTGGGVGRGVRLEDQERLVMKDGTCNVTASRFRKRHRRFLVDIFTTMVDLKWRYLISVFFATFVCSWIAFALIWYIQAMIHGDYHALNDTEWVSCVANVYDFPTAILFSVETQHTIGYGVRVVEDICPFTYILLMLQSCFGVLAQSTVMGVVFAKLLRPKRRSRTLVFSSKAVINIRDGGYCFLFRVGDLRRSYIIAASLRAMLVRSRQTPEGESIPLCQYSMALETEAKFGDNFVFLGWPATVVHRINDASPLWDVSFERLNSERFEIIVILEGTIENTGMTTQIRTSYLPADIFWGSRLKPLVTYHTVGGHYDVDFSLFHATEVLTTMPECSARVHSTLQAAASLVTTSPAIPAKGSNRHKLERFPASLVVRPPRSTSATSLYRLLQRRWRKKNNKPTSPSTNDLLTCVTTSTGTGEQTTVDVDTGDVSPIDDLAEVIVTDIDVGVLPTEVYVDNGITSSSA